MIEASWQLVGILFAAVVALLGGFWKFLKLAGNNKTRFQQDALAMRSIILSSELVPQIVSLIEKVEIERGQTRGEAIEQILSRSSFAYPIQSTARTMSKMNDVDTLYLRTVSLAFRSAYDLLIATFLPALTLLWLFIGVYWDQFVLLILFGSFVMTIKTIFDVYKYTNAVKQFIDKDNEIRLGRSGI